MEISIFTAVRERNVDAVRSILLRDPLQASAVEPDSCGNQSLHMVGRGEIAELLIKAGADVNARGDDGMMPLHTAAKEGCSDVVRVLIANGAKLNETHEFGLTPLVYAVCAASPEGVETTRILLEAGAPYDILAAAARGDLARVRELLRGNSRLLSELSPFYSKELILLAAMNLAKSLGSVGDLNDRREILKLLLENGLNLSKEELLKIADDYPSITELAAAIRRHVMKI
jgi:ankyrin repeat protein